MAALKDALFCNHHALAKFESGLPECVASSKVLESLNEQKATLHSHSVGGGGVDLQGRLRWEVLDRGFKGTFKDLLKHSENTLEKFDGDRLSACFEESKAKLAKYNDTLSLFGEAIDPNLKARADAAHQHADATVAEFMLIAIYKTPKTNEVQMKRRMSPVVADIDKVPGVREKVNVLILKEADSIVNPQTKAIAAAAPK
eukprot:474300-Pyramimonas_sp.AAC.1